MRGLTIDICTAFFGLLNTAYINLEGKNEGDMLNFNQVQRGSMYIRIPVISKKFQDRTRNRESKASGLTPQPSSRHSHCPYALP